MAKISNLWLRSVRMFEVATMLLSECISYGEGVSS